MPPHRWWLKPTSYRKHKRTKGCCWRTSKYHAAAGLSWAKCDTRVFARGLPSSQSKKRTKLIAAAVAICGNRVLANPRYRVFRRPKTAVPWEIVPSTPALWAYFSQNSAVFCRWRAACMASYWGRAAIVTLRPCFLERVHKGRAEHGEQSDLEKATRINGVP